MNESTPQIRFVRLADRFKGIHKTDERARSLPSFDPKEPELEDGRHTVEFFAGTKKTAPIWFLAAKVTNHWPDLFEITEEEFDAAIAATKTVTVG